MKSRPSAGSAPPQDAHWLLPGAPLDATIAFFCERLGFRLDSIAPADDPAIAELTGHGLALRLDRAYSGAPGTLLMSPAALGLNAPALPCRAPNGTHIALAPEPLRSPSEPPTEVTDTRLTDATAWVTGETHIALAPEPLRSPSEPPTGVTVTRLADATAWVTGRAGMRYRDLIPGRAGGRLVASHIHIPRGGPVPDGVHYHELDFQLIICLSGWVRLVYEDQGPAFVLNEGDAVLQPPQIRHRVLESSAGLEVLELASPAWHPTRFDHALTLPTPEERPERCFSGQRFVLHQAQDATWTAAEDPGFERRSLALEPATRGAARAARLRARSDPRPGTPIRLSGALRFLFVLRGAARLERPGDLSEPLTVGDAALIPAGQEHSLCAENAELELIDLRLESSRSSPRRATGAANIDGVDRSSPHP